MHNTLSHIYLLNVTKFQKFMNWKFNEFFTYTWCKFLSAWNVGYIKAVMKTDSYRHFLLPPSCQVVAKGHTNLKKPAIKSCRFVQICMTFCCHPELKG